MKEFSKEVIEIDGKEYTLFLNRLGVVAFERYSEEIQNKIEDNTRCVQTLVDKHKDEKLVIKEDTNPFEDEFMKESEELLNETEKYGLELSQRMYWILLYNEHKMNINDVKELYNKACEEYGRDQIDALAMQMLNEVNSNKFENNHKELKNLKALYQPKK